MGLPKLLLVFLCVITLLCLGVWIGFGVIFTLNFTFALLSFHLIVGIVFYTQKCKVQSLIQNATQEELEALAQSYKSKQEIAEEEEEEFWEESQKIEEEKLSISAKNTESQEESAPNPSKKRFWKNFSVINAKTGVKMFFYPLRLLAYGFLVLGILILIHHQVFDSLAFFSGLIVANILIVLALLMRN